MTTDVNHRGILEGINIDASQRPIAFAKKLGNILGQAGYTIQAQSAFAYLDSAYRSLFDRIAAGDEQILGREHFDAVAIQLGHTRTIGALAFNGCVSPLHRNRKLGNGDIKPTAGLFNLDFATISEIVRPIRRANTSLPEYPDEVSKTNLVTYDNAENYAVFSTSITSLVEACRERGEQMQPRAVETCIITLGNLLLH